MTRWDVLLCYSSSMTPDFTHEDALPGPVAGVDEVGRGPLAGPVVACAVVLDRARVPDGLADSKALTPMRREALAATIREDAQVGLGVCSVAEIDADGVGRATLLAMRRAVAALPVRPASALIDGTQLPLIPGMRLAALPRADALSASVAAASIVAKVHRDAEMVRLASLHPHYAWERNKGYGTKAHVAGLDAHGVTPHHRRSFAPIAKRLTKTNGW